MGISDSEYSSFSPDEQIDNYELIGETTFPEAQKQLLSLGIRPEREGAGSEILIKLTSVPTYEELEALASTLDSNIELALVRGHLDWYMARGFAGRGNDISGPFQLIVPEGGVLVHTHPNDTNRFARPSYYDVAHALRKSASYGVIGGKGITAYTGVERVPAYRDESPKDPYNLVGYFHDQVPLNTPTDNYGEIMQKMGMTIAHIPFGAQARQYWSKISKGKVGK